MKKSKRCVWTLDDSVDWDSYDTSCDQSFSLTEGTLKQNKMKFCCYCGKPIKEKKVKSRI